MENFGLFYYHVNGTRCQAARHHRTVQDRARHFVRRLLLHFFNNKLFSNFLGSLLVPPTLSHGRSLRSISYTTPEKERHNKRAVACGRLLRRGEKAPSDNDCVTTTKCRNVLAIKSCLSRRNAGTLARAERNVARRGGNK